MSENTTVAPIAEEVQMLVKEHDSFDATYKAIRQEVADKVTEAIKQKTVLFALVGARLRTSSWLKAVELHSGEAVKKIYTCVTCSAFLREYSNLCWINDDGKIVVPMMDAMRNNLSPQVFASLQEDEAFAAWMQAVQVGKIRALEILTTELCRETNVDKNGITRMHLFGADAATVAEYNDEAEGGINIPKVQLLHRQALRHMDHIEKIEKITEGMEKLLDMPTSISLMHPYIKLLKQLKSIDSKNAYIYIAGLITRKQYTWLVQMNDSCAGQVISLLDLLISDGFQSLQLRMERMSEMINRFTSPDKYKNHTRTLSAQLLDQATEYVREHAPTLMQRKWLTVDQVQDKFIWKQSKPEAEQVAAEDPLDRARRLAGAANGEKQATSEVDVQKAVGAMDNAVRKMSPVDFLASLPQMATIRALGIPIRRLFVTTQASDGVAYPQVVDYNASALAEHAMYLTSVDHLDVRDYLRPGEIAQVSQVIGIARPNENRNEHMLVVTGIKKFFPALLKGFGNLIMGASIDNSLRGMAPGFVELGKNFALEDIDENQELMAGFWLTVGLQFRVTTTKGIERTIEIVAPTSTEL